MSATCSRTTESMNSSTRGRSAPSRSIASRQNLWFSAVRTAVFRCNRRPQTDCDAGCCGDFAGVSTEKSCTLPRSCPLTPPDSSVKTISCFSRSGFGRQGPEVQILSPRPGFLSRSVSYDSPSPATAILWGVCGDFSSISVDATRRTVAGLRVHKRLAASSKRTRSGAE